MGTMDKIVQDEAIIAKEIEGKAKEEILKAFLPRLRYLANRLASRVPIYVDISDLIQAGAMGLMDAIKKFDPKKGAQFKTYAEFRMRGAMLDEIRGMDWIPRSVKEKFKKLQHTYRDLEKKHGRAISEEEVASAMNMGLEEYWDFLKQVRGATLVTVEECGINRDNKKEFQELIVEPENKNPLSSLLFGDFKGILTKGINELSEKEKLVISLYYYDELTMKEIGVALKITESRVSQIHTQALFRLKAKLDEWRRNSL